MRTLRGIEMTPGDRLPTLAASRYHLQEAVVLAERADKLLVLAFEHISPDLGDYGGQLHQVRLYDRPGWAAVDRALSTGTICGVVVGAAAQLAPSAKEFAALRSYLRDQGQTRIPRADARRDCT
ncbi:hypothetical protein ACFQL8_09295 [Streptomyces goshikiensis]|uniref:hypothetical protein n=1 Tax=Streptomyces goshikiensis TaxID=1942 RepID=UPI001671F928|nr:hypothetical protein [Streptomyces goshikiensis]GHD82333.1 hypothetical protein GCM10010336_69710 [Streptomyces goshikiensis]